MDTSNSTKEKINSFWNSYLKNIDLCDKMSTDNCATTSISLAIPLEVNYKNILNYTKYRNITIESYFIAVFAYTLATFAGGDYIQFCIRQVLNKLEFPLIVSCQNDTCLNFIKNCMSQVEKISKLSCADVRELKKEYHIDTSIWLIFDESSNIDHKNTITQGQLYFYIKENKNQIHIEVNFSDSYLKEKVESFITTFSLIAEEMCMAQKLSDINLISSNDLSLYNKINDTDHKLKYTDIIESWNDNVKKFPNNNCIQYLNTTYTYLEVEYITNYICQELKRIGLKQQSPVAFIVNRGVLYFICILALIKYNAVYIPIDETFPNKRILSMLKEAKAEYIIIDELLHDKHQSLKKELCQENLTQFIFGKKLIAKALQKKEKITFKIPNKNTIAAIVFTSGTTKKPKGILITRRMLINLALYYQHFFNIKDFDVYGYYFGVGYITHVSMFFASNCGSCIDIIPAKCQLDMSAFNKHINKKNITHMYLPARICRTLLQTTKNKTVKVICKGGELIEDFEYNGSVKLYEACGATESPNNLLCPFENKEEFGCVGKSTFNVRVYIVDKNMRRLPVYALGIICYAGNNVAAGYLNNDKLTKEVFIDNPFEHSQHINNKMFITGDYGYYTANGNAIYVGRKDNMIKIRGNRVDLSEIEACIKELNNVDEVAVVDVRMNNEQKIVACVTNNNKVTYSEIINYIKAQKPNYMIPAFVLFLEKIPYTNNGKIDKRKIADLTEIEKNKSEGTSYTSDYLKNQSINAFAKALSVDASTINDNSDFIKLGGDSMTAVQLSILYKEKTNLQVAPIDILNNPLFKEQYKLIINNIDDNNKLNIHIFNKQPGKPKLIFIYPAIGGIESYINLSKNLSSDIEFAGIEHYNILNYNNPVLDITELAKRNIKLLRNYQKNGPYYLGGYSFGGLVAFEMAKLLKKSGEKIGCLFLLDSIFTNLIITKKKKNKIYKTLKNYTDENYEKIINFYNIKGLSDKTANKIIDFNLWNYINSYTYRSTIYTDPIIYYLAPLENFSQNETELSSEDLFVRDYFDYINKTICGKRQFVIYRKKNWRFFNAEYVSINSSHKDLVLPEASKQIADNINKYFKNLNK